MRKSLDPVMKLIYINPDNPHAILEKEYLLRIELRCRQSNGEEDLIIKKRKIITKSFMNED